MKTYILSFLVFFIGIIPFSHAQKPVIPEKVKENIKSRVDNGINTGIVIGIVTSEGITYFSYGVKSTENDKKVDENSIFEIGSITKTFTGVMLAEMVLKEELNLDDPIQNLIPEGVAAPTRNGQSIQLVHLSNHTSGLPRLPNNMTPSDPSNPYADYSAEQMFEFLDNYKLTRDIGSEFEYSNYAVGMLGYLLANKRNMTYEQLMMEVIAEPLAMKNTAIVFTPNMKENLAFGHSHGIQVKNWDLSTLAGAGAIRSSAVDMTKYLSANMGITKSELSPALQLTHQVTSGEEIETKVGLGWIVSERDGNKYIWHNGATGGYRAFCGFKKNGDLGVVVLTNSEGDITDLGMHLLDPTKTLNSPKTSIASKMKFLIDNKGIKKAKKIYWNIIENDEDAYNFEESELNSLGYEYLQENEIKNAKSVLELNVQTYPESSNVYDSYAEVLMLNKQNKKAIVNYKKSLELNPGNINAIEKLKELGVDTKNMVPEIIIEDSLLESYVGEYELAPGFILTITKDGNQMIAQATGQGAVPVYPKSNNEFYYKVVDAQLKFHSNDKGEVESVTLYQAGQEIVGKKLKEPNLK